MIQIRPWRGPYTNHDYPPILREVIYFLEKIRLTATPKKHQWGPTSIVPSFYFDEKTHCGFRPTLRTQKNAKKSPMSFGLLNWQTFVWSPFLGGFFLITRKVYFCKKTNHQIPWDYSRFMVVLLESKETWIGFTPSDQEHHVDPNPKQGDEPILRATFYQILLGQCVWLKKKMRNFIQEHVKNLTFFPIGVSKVMSKIHGCFTGKFPGFIVVKKLKHTLWQTNIGSMEYHHFQ